MPAILMTLTVFARWHWVPAALAQHLETVLAAFIETEFPEFLKALSQEQRERMEQSL